MPISHATSVLIPSSVQCDVFTLVYGKRAGQNREAFPLASGHLFWCCEPWSSRHDMAPAPRNCYELRLPKGDLHEIGLPAMAWRGSKVPPLLRIYQQLKVAGGWGSQVHTHPQEYMDC